MRRGRSTRPAEREAIGCRPGTQPIARQQPAARCVGDGIYRGVRLGHDRCCSGIVAQTGLLRSCIEGADLTVPVPSCPGWNIGQLLRHLGGARRWAEQTVRTPGDRAAARRALPRPLRVHRENPGRPWLTEGAARWADTLRGAGPDAEPWTDATLALGAEFTVEEDVGVDAVDEWMELGSLPIHFEIRPSTREVPGPGRTVQLPATDTAPDTAAEWRIDLTGEAITWRRAHEKAAVAVRGPLTDLLLVSCKRRPARSEGIEILGDEQFLGIGEIHPRDQQVDEVGG